MIGKTSAPVFRVRRVFAWIGCLWMIGWLVLCADQFLAQTNPGKMLAVVLMIVTVVSPFYLIILIPLGGLGYLMGSAKRLRRWQVAISLWLPLLAGVAAVVPTLLERLHPERRFRRIARVDLPAQATHLRHYFSGGLLGGHRSRFVFEAPSGETDALIRAMEFERQRGFTLSSDGFNPALETWKDPEEWLRRVPDSRICFILHTDASHTHVDVTVDD